MFYRATREGRDARSPVISCARCWFIMRTRQTSLSAHSRRINRLSGRSRNRETKTRGPGNAQRDRNVNAEWQVRWVQRSAWIHPPCRSHPRAKVPHLNKPFDILFPPINKTTRWLIITRHSDTLRRSQDSREMRNSPCLSFRITFNCRVLEWTDRDCDREFSSCN